MDQADDMETRFQTPFQINQEWIADPLATLHLIWISQKPLHILQIEMPSWLRLAHPRCRTASLWLLAWPDLVSVPRITVQDAFRGNTLTCAASNSFCDL